MKKFRSNFDYLPYIQLLTTLISILTLLFYFDYQLLIGSCVMYFMIQGVGISIGYHRYLSHKSFELKHKWMEWPILWLGCLSGTGSPLGWEALHKSHHRHTDKHGDPHSPKVHGIKVLLMHYKTKLNKFDIKNTLVDKNHKFVHNYYYLLLIMWLAFSFAQDINLALYMVIIPMCMSIWVTVFTNYINHSWGYRNYNTKDNSKNNPCTAFLNFGEGWHNNHHARPSNYYFGTKWYEFDIAGNLIRLIKL